jgi:DNA-binding transcriptional LysR family regulator
VCGPVLGHERRVLAVGPDHPLARRASVSIEDVADYATLSVVEELFPKEIAEAKVPDKTPKGRTIRRHPTAFGDLAGHDPGRARVHINMLITSGEVVLPTTLAVEKILGEGILYVPIIDMPPIRRALVWQRRAIDARLRGFIAVARDILRDGP